MCFRTRPICMDGAMNQMSQNRPNFDLDVLRKYYGLIFSQDRSAVANKNRKILNTFGNLIANEVPQMYSIILGQLIESWEMLKYYEERWPVAVSLAVLDDKNSEFFYSEEDHKMQILFEKFLDILKHHNGQEIAHDTAELAVARFWSYFGSSSRKAISKKINTVKEKSKNKHDAFYSKISESAKNKTKRITKKQKIAHIDSFIDGIDEYIRRPNLSKIVTLLEDIVSFLEREAAKIEKIYEYMKYRTKANKDINK